MINGIGYGNDVSGYLFQSKSTTEKKSAMNSKMVDTVEFSTDANERMQTEKKMTATSGKDTLGITKGDKDNSFIVHFSDSAMVNRAISRGYITVNGIKLKLSEETKQKLLKTDKHAESERIKAYNKYVLQHEMAVAKQQSEAWRKALEGTSDEIRNLLEIITEDIDKPEASEKQRMQYDKALKAYGSSMDGVSWSQFEWKTYDTQMSVSVEDTVAVENISIGETFIR